MVFTSSVFQIGMLSTVSNRKSVSAACLRISFSHLTRSPWVWRVWASIQLFCGAIRHAAPLIVQHRPRHIPWGTSLEAHRMVAAALHTPFTLGEGGGVDRPCEALRAPFTRKSRSCPQNVLQTCASSHGLELGFSATPSCSGGWGRAYSVACREVSSWGRVVKFSEILLSIWYSLG